MRSNYKPIGPHIRIIDDRNTDLKIELLLGVSVQKVFIPSIANTVGTDFKKYKIVRKNQFVYIPDTSRRGDKIGLAMLEDYDEALVSQAYTVFEILDHNELDPEYLMMWFRRPEFDRYARFKSHGSVREIFGWEEMCEVELPIPSIEKQREIVKEYNTIIDRIKLNEQLNQKLEETAQALYKHWFVDFEFPDENGQPYKSNGGNMVWNEELEKEIPEGWSKVSLSCLASYSDRRVNVSDLSSNNYISTENMLQEKGGVIVSSGLPSAKTVIKFKIDEILISNIRPYFKKIWLAEFNGGCSNDVLCIQPREGIGSKYLYYILEKDEFFHYVMQGSKGTKMPRGDKDWIMNYDIVKPRSEVTIHFDQKVSELKDFGKQLIEQNELLKQLAPLLLSKMTRVEIDVKEVVG